MTYRPPRRDILRAVALGATSLAWPSLLAGCSGQSATGSLASEGATGTAKDPVKVALILPTGADQQTAAIAKALRQAAELAVFDLNQPGLQLMVKDDRGSEEGARAAVAAMRRQVAHPRGGRRGALGGRRDHPRAAVLAHNGRGRTGGAAGRRADHQLLE